MLLEVKDHLRFSSNVWLTVSEPHTHTRTPPTPTPPRLQTGVSLEVVQKLFPRDSSLCVSSLRPIFRLFLRLSTAAHSP